MRPTQVRVTDTRSLFNPADFRLPVGCTEFAQSPQAVFLDDRVRVFFSSRNRDASDTYLSQALYVDFDVSLNDVISVCQYPVLPLGELGAFDEHGLFPFHVFNDGNRLIAYTCGWSRRISVPVETGIGIAYSDDGGKNFMRPAPGPIMSSNINEPFLVGDPFVKKYKGRYHMWFMFGTQWLRVDGQPERVYKIGHATSSDGVNFERISGESIIADKLNDQESLALPSVIAYNGGYHMFFCYRESVDFRNNRERGYQLGYAYSDDLVLWDRLDQLLLFDQSEDDWDSEMRCYPHIFIHPDQGPMVMYNGNKFGKYGFGIGRVEFE